MILHQNTLFMKIYYTQFSVRFLHTHFIYHIILIIKNPGVGLSKGINTDSLHRLVHSVSLFFHFVTKTDFSRLS